MSLLTQCLNELRALERPVLPEPQPAFTLTDEQVAATDEMEAA